MGCRPSIVVSHASPPSLSPQDVLDLTLLGLTADHTHSLFAEFDRSRVLKNPLLSINELTAVLGLPHSRLVIHLLNSLCTHKTELTFREFAINIWTLLIRSREMLIHAAFDAFLLNSKDYLTLSSIRVLLQEATLGDFPLDSLTLDIVDGMETSINKLVSRDEFLYTVQRYPRLAQPLIGMQESMRRRMIGRDVWVKLAAEAARLLSDDRVKQLLASISPSSQMLVSDAGAMKKRIDSYRISPSISPSSTFDSAFDRDVIDRKALNRRAGRGKGVYRKNGGGDLSLSGISEDGGELLKMGSGIEYPSAYMGSKPRVRRGPSKIRRINTS